MALSKHMMKTPPPPPFFWNYDVDIIQHSTNRHNVEVAFHIKNTGDLELVQTEKKLHNFCQPFTLKSRHDTKGSNNPLSDVNRKAIHGKRPMGCYQLSVQFMIIKNVFWNMH